MLGRPSPGSCTPVVWPAEVPRIRAAHPHFSVSSRTLLSRASLARLHAAGFPEILDRNQEPVEISQPVDPASFSLRLEEADPLQGNEIILQFLAVGRWDGSSLRCLLWADPRGLLGESAFPKSPQPTSLLAQKNSLQRCCFLQHLLWRQSRGGFYDDALVLSRHS